ncbi:MAG: YHYH protein [Paraglaciecola chathamensis]
MKRIMCTAQTYLIIALGVILCACGDSSTDANYEETGQEQTSTETSTDSTTDDVETGSETEPDSDASVTASSLLFFDDAVIETITTQSCTLSGGTQTTCYRITLAGEPAVDEIGPFCPPTIESDASQGGIWFDGSGEVYDIDGEFISNLDQLYGDGWLLYDPSTGEVNITDTQAACEAAARPNVDPAYQNYCVQCDLEYYGGGVSETVLLPVTPVPLSTPSYVNANMGVSLNGVILAAQAPVDAILSNYTIAAFDDCGGHINPFDGYHYHAATGCSTASEEEDGHASQIGYALDGYRIYAMLDASGYEETDLDECRGHTDDTRGYHYHVASPGENMFIGCFHGEQGEWVASE